MLNRAIELVEVDLNIMLLRFLIILIRMRPWSFFILESVLRRKITSCYPYAFSAYIINILFLNILFMFRNICSILSELFVCRAHYH
jgi:hypothetical protein